MTKRLYSLRDNKVKEFNPPCVFLNDAAAVRSFGDMVTRDKDTLVSLHREDFSLYYLGDLDTESGVLVQNEPPHALAVGSDFGEDQ